MNGARALRLEAVTKRYPCARASALCRARGGTPRNLPLRSPRRPKMSKIAQQQATVLKEFSLFLGVVRAATAGACST